MQFIFTILWCWQDLDSDLDRMCTSVLEACRSLEHRPKTMIYGVCVRFEALLAGPLSTSVSTHSPSEKGKVLACSGRSFPCFLSLCGRRLTPGQDTWLDSALWALQSNKEACVQLEVNSVVISMMGFFFSFVKRKHNFSLDLCLIWDLANLN